jgi:hypothetical protein
MRVLLKIALTVSIVVLAASCVELSVLAYRKKGSVCMLHTEQ